MTSAPHDHYSTHSFGIYGSLFAKQRHSRHHMKVRIIMPHCRMQQVTCCVFMYIVYKHLLACTCAPAINLFDASCWRVIWSHKDRRQFMTIATQRDMLSAIATAADRHATDEKIIASINKPQNALKGASASLFTTTAKKTDIKIKVRSKFRKTN